MSGAPPFVYDDGGRAAAGFRGKTGDCVTRAIAITSGLPYRGIYNYIKELGAEETLPKNLLAAGVVKRSHPRTGVKKTLYAPLLHDLGFDWVPMMRFGVGCTVHVTPDELPATGRLILRLSRHLAAYIDGELHDTYDSSREGKRCVYGYWVLNHPRKAVT